MGLSELFMILVTCSVAWLIWQNTGRREQAIAAAMRHCQKQEVQLLDQTVSLNRLRPYWKDQLCLERHYGFEFTSTGERRYKGHLTLIGKRLGQIELEPHRIDSDGLNTSTTTQKRERPGYIKPI